MIDLLRSFPFQHTSTSDVGQTGCLRAQESVSRNCGLHSRGQRRGSGYDTSILAGEEALISLLRHVLATWELSYSHDMVIH